MISVGIIITLHKFKSGLSESHKITYKKGRMVPGVSNSSFIF